MASSKVVGARIRKYRDRLGLTQREIADVCGVTVPTVWQWEHGRLPLPENLQSLARVFGISIETLLGKRSSAPPATA